MRSAATLALGSVFDRGDRVALSAAVAAATDKDPTVRGGALWAIGVLAHKGDKDAVNTVRPSKSLLSFSYGRLLPILLLFFSLLPSALIFSRRTLRI